MSTLPTCRRILGIDYGTVRVGLALSDELRMLATPLEVVPREKVATHLPVLLREKSITEIVVGLPRNMDGSYGPKTQEVRQFVQSLNLPEEIKVIFWDERLTSKSVERMLIEADLSRKRRKEVVDKLAAQQILQSYLDSLDSQFS